jgi:hypothetical protein
MVEIFIVCCFDRYDVRCCTKVCSGWGCCVEVHVAKPAQSHHAQRRYIEQRSLKAPKMAFPHKNSGSRKH